MGYPAKEERNKEIVRLRNKQNWTFNKIAAHFNINRRTVREIYIREVGRNPKMKMKSGYPQSRLDIRP
jgi:hypothetical protein